jgi:hypothetical protein
MTPLISPRKRITHAAKAGSLATGLSDLGRGTSDVGFNSRKKRISSKSPGSSHDAGEVPCGRMPRVEEESLPLGTGDTPGLIASDSGQE